MGQSRQRALHLSELGNYKKMLCHIEQKGKGDDTKVPESKSDFSDIILTKEEIEGIQRLQLINEDHKDRIPGFEGLLSARFVTLAHPKSIKSDGYGGYTSDEIYKLSDRYYLYSAYCDKIKLVKAAEILSNLLP